MKYEQAFPVANPYYIW
jgi:hypothetical protein